LPQAFAFNPLFVLALPVLIPIVILGLFAGLRRKSPPLRHMPNWLFWSLVVVLVIYTVLRNLPYPPFDTLAPHRLG
jgi:hypothetical protein